MNFYELIRCAILNLRAHKLRVFLTMIGIIIGIASVVAILSIGAGLQTQVSDSTVSESVNTLRVTFEPDEQSMQVENPFRYQDFRALENIDGVEKVEQSNDMFSGMLGMSTEAQYFEQNAYLTLELYRSQRPPLVAGRLITAEDNEFQNYVIDLSQEQARQLFGDDPAAGIGKAVKLSGQFFQVVGIVGGGANELLGMDLSYIPQFAERLLQDDSMIFSIDVKVREGYDQETVFADVRDELQYQHPQLHGDYKQEDPTSLIKDLQKVISSITGFIALVTGISLFVGGVGVMNIMYVSVTERRREIGIRRALGAKPATILLQFLVEAVLITFCGGLIGIGAGYGVSKLIGIFIELKPVMTAGIMLQSSIICIAVGIIFGIIPARRASRLDPIEAIYR
jgi:putative ABC transport system permease protein